MAGPLMLAMTGATGFVGQATLVPALEGGRRVRALTRREQAPQPGVTWVRGDLGDPAALAALCAGADAVLHIAGAVKARDAAAFEAANVAGTAAVLKAAREAGGARFVHVSSLTAREPRLSDYGASKARAEALVTASPLDWTIVRPPAVYGPGDAEMLDLFRMARRGFVMVPPLGRLSLIHVDDLARLLIALAAPQPETSHQIFEPDDGRPVGWSHSSFGRAIGWAVGRRVGVLPAPRSLLGLAAAGDRLLRRERAKLTPDRVSYICHPDWTVSAVRRPPPDLWQPAIPTRTGLKETARWYREKGWL